MREGFFMKEWTPEGMPDAYKNTFSVLASQKVKSFHESFPVYSLTPLVKYTNTAQKLGVHEIYVKDESKRFGLNAFKALGGSYAIGRYVGRKLGLCEEELSYASLTDRSVKEKLGDITFVTATDGNHGRGVAWAAKELGFKSVVYMPKGSAQERLQNIKKAGADASITDMNYDDCVRLSKKMADEKGWVVVQDTAWEGYDEIPTWIMQGYGTMALEAIEELKQAPTHVFLQAGVGSMAAAVAQVLTDAYRENPPKIIIVEPNRADCFYQSSVAGERTFVTGEMNTIMAGLACGEPCTIAWEILKSVTSAFLSCPDYAAAEGMRILAKPEAGDEPMVSGESGASAFGCVSEILMNSALSHIKEALGLNADSRLLFFSTEGATDTKNYRAIVEDGAYPRK
ncbi:MAG: diaminopropionate ammonia-lyase [Clostridia bacterium]|nr:diaminopropionate ammonia-lyase [Clostridia bacterium]